MEEFIGFTFNNIHSSSLGIVRISKGGLLNQPFLPQGKDMIDDGVAKDETYYFGSNNFTLTFTIDYIYGPITETQFQQLKGFCKTKGVAPLLFDEYLHKTYLAKITGSAVSYYNIYDFNGERKYRGEGSLTFTCYYPYAAGRFSYIEDALDNTPTWESGKIINLQEQFSSAVLIAEERVLSDLQKSIGALTIKKTQYKDELNGSFSTLSTGKTEVHGLLINNPDVLVLPSKWECGIQQEGAEQYFVINNAGDLDMYFSFTTTKVGTFSMALDGRKQWTIEKNIADAIEINGHNRAFQDPTTGRAVKNCKMVEGDFFNIPPGIHRLSFLVEGLNTWNTHVVQDLEFHYIYY